MKTEILIVHPNPDVLKLIGNCLEAKNMGVTYALNQADANAQLELEDQSFDLVISHPDFYQEKG